MMQDREISWLGIRVGLIVGGVIGLILGITSMALTGSFATVGPFIPVALETALGASITAAVFFAAKIVREFGSRDFNAVFWKPKTLLSLIGWTFCTAFFAYEAGALIGGLVGLLFR